MHCGAHPAFSSGAEDPQSVWGMGTETAQRVQPASSAISRRDHTGELTGTSENKQCRFFLPLNSSLIPEMWPWKGRKKKKTLKFCFQAFFVLGLSVGVATQQTALCLDPGDRLPESY